MRRHFSCTAQKESALLAWLFSLLEPSALFCHSPGNVQIILMKELLQNNLFQLADLLLESINLRLKQLVLVAFHELIDLCDVALFVPLELLFCGNDAFVLNIINANSIHKITAVTNLLVFVLILKLVAGMKCGHSLLLEVDVP